MIHTTGYKAFVHSPVPPCLLDGEPHWGDLPERVVYVGMELEPNKAPRYNGRPYHWWFNLPCYESAAKTRNGGGE